jgi:hypothetical protein
MGELIYIFAICIKFIGIPLGIIFIVFLIIGGLSNASKNNNSVDK